MIKNETRKEEIIRISASLFKKKGYSAVTMRDIAQELGIKAASLYNHIKSKQEILIEIILSLAEEFTEGMDEIYALDLSAVEKLKKIILLHVSISSTNTDGMASLNADWMHLEEKLEYYLKLRSDYEDKFRQIIKAGIGKGEVIDIDPDIILFSILSTLRSLYLWIPRKEFLHKEDLSNHLSQVMLEGIKNS